MPNQHLDQIHIIRSFVHDNQGGNPAGVCVDLNQNLTEGDMQLLAQKMGLSETAFISKEDDYCDFSLRFFTPTDEVPLCGHATIASFWYLKVLGLIDYGDYLQKTKAGILKIRVLESHQQIDSKIQIVMEQAKPEKIHNPKLTLESLHACFPNLKLNPALPLEIWTTGLKDVLMPVMNTDALNTLEVDYPKLAALSESLDVVGVHAFSIDADGQVHTRNFAPLYGIDEEAATGTSNGALTAYIHLHLFSDKQSIKLSILQGENMGQTSMIQTESIWDEDDQTIWVGGFCAFEK